MRKLLPKSEFSRNVLTLMTGTSVAQAIPVAISPILTRLYSPDQFGVFALFVAVATVLGAIANGRYELAIMLPDDEEDALDLAALGLLISAVLSVSLLAIVVFFGREMAAFMGNAGIRPWLYLVPVSVFFSGLYNVLNYYNSRIKRFPDIARANVYKALILAAVQLCVGMVKPGAGGLIVGQVLSGIGANMRLARNTLKGKGSLRALISADRMRMNAKRYSDFPKFSLPAVFANTLSSNIANVLISRFYSTQALGQYALVQRVMGMPAALLGNAIGQVFFQRASEERRRTGTAKHVFLHTFRKLIIISVPIYLTMYFVVEDAFVVIFGEPWREAGSLARILTPLFAVRFVVSPLSLMTQVSLKNKLGLLGNVALLLLTSIVIWSGGSASLSLREVLEAMVLVLCAFYMLFLFAIYRITCSEVRT